MKLYCGDPGCSVCGGVVAEVYGIDLSSERKEANKRKGKVRRVLWLLDKTRKLSEEAPTGTDEYIPRSVDTMTEGERKLYLESMGF